MSPARLLRKLVGGLLIAAGGLIAALCGLCTGFFGITAVIGLVRTPHEAFWDTAPYLAVGLLATTVGAVLLWAGIVMMRDR